MGSSLHTHSPDMNGGQSVVLSFGSDRQVLLWTSGSSHVSKRSVKNKTASEAIGSVSGEGLAHNPSPSTPRRDWASTPGSG
jgi:hypothetical protein